MKKVFKVTAVVICISMLMQTISVCAETPENAQQNNTQTSASAADNTQKKDEPKILYEMIDKRTADTEQFRMSDGTYMIAQYPYPVHYNDNGTWKDIDNTLTADNQSVADSSVSNSKAIIKNGYKNSKNNLDIKFAQQTDEENLVSIQSDNHQIS